MPSLILHLIQNHLHLLVLVGNDTKSMNAPLQRVTVVVSTCFLCNCVISERRKPLVPLGTVIKGDLLNFLAKTPFKLTAVDHLRFTVHLNL